MGVIVNVLNYKGKVYHSRLEKEGRISFAATFDGEHRICLRSIRVRCLQAFRVSRLDALYGVAC